EREIARRGRLLRVVVLGNRATHRNTAEGTHATDGCLQVIAADVIEVDVDPLGRSLVQLPGQVTLSVVDGRVEAQLLESGDLFLAACRSDHAGGTQLAGKLSHRRPHGTGSTGDEDHV